MFAGYKKMLKKENLKCKMPDGIFQFASEVNKPSLLELKVRLTGITLHLSSSWKACIKSSLIL